MIWVDLMEVVLNEKKTEDNSNCRMSYRNNARNNKPADMKNKVTVRVGEAIEDI